MKKSVSTKANVQPEDVVRFFEELVAGCKAGKIVLEGDDGFVTIDPSLAAEMEVKATSKDATCGKDGKSGKEGKVKLKLELTWRETPKQRGPLTVGVSSTEPAPPISMGTGAEIAPRQQAQAPATKDAAGTPAVQSQTPSAKGPEPANDPARETAKEPVAPEKASQAAAEPATDTAAAKKGTASKTAAKQAGTQKTAAKKAPAKKAAAKKAPAKKGPAKKSAAAKNAATGSKTASAAEKIATAQKNAAKGGAAS